MLPPNKPGLLTG